MAGTPGNRRCDASGASDDIVARPLGEPQMLDRSRTESEEEVRRFFSSTNRTAGVYCKTVLEKAKLKNETSSVTLAFLSELLLVTSSYFKLQSLYTLQLRCRSLGPGCRIASSLDSVRAILSQSQRVAKFCSHFRKLA